MQSVTVLQTGASTTLTGGFAGGGVVTIFLGTISTEQLENAVLPWLSEIVTVTRFKPRVLYEVFKT